VLSDSGLLVRGYWQCFFPSVSFAAASLNGTVVFFVRYTSFAAAILTHLLHIFAAASLTHLQHIFAAASLTHLLHTFAAASLTHLHIFAAASLTPLLQQVWHIYYTSLLQQVWHLLGTCKVWSKGLKRHFRHFSNTCVHTQASSNKKHTHAHTHTPSTNSHASLTPSKCRNRPEGDKSVPCHRKGAAG